MIRSGAFPQRFALFTYFIILIVLGSLLLLLPVAWQGTESIRYDDALFTSVSAVCVTGLITLDTAQFSFFGQIVILLLIQFGGLGVITFTTLVLTGRKRKWSLISSKLIRQYSMDAIEHREGNIIQMVVLFTFLLEIVGAICIYFTLDAQQLDHRWFYALFHSISAFCNAGFSLFPDSLESQAENPALLSIIMFLIFSGGIGFVVIRDIFRTLQVKGRHLSVHSRLVLRTTFLLIVIPALFFWLNERKNTLSEMTLFHQIINSLFQSITTRTAGFNAISQSQLTEGSQMLTVPLMFIGGAPGSIAGGVKVTTFALIVIALVKGLDSRSDIKIAKRRIPSATVSKAHLYAAKGLFLVAAAVSLLMIVEPFSIKEIFFEVFSAIGTVGLSLGITADLSIAGKIIIMLTMFAGRVGLISMAIPLYRAAIEKIVDYPTGEVMIG